MKTVPVTAPLLITPVQRPRKGVASAIMPFCRAETVIFLLFWSVWMLVSRSRLFLDPGALWHPVVGQIILSTGHLITADPFSFTRAGDHWIAQWWLGDCILA